MCTGNIIATTSFVLSSAVYPCVYREHQVALHCIENRVGLSLCVQGTFKAYLMGQFVNRFIPVCTGNIDNTRALINASTVYPCVYREHFRI